MLSSTIAQDVEDTTFPESVNFPDKLLLAVASVAVPVIVRLSAMEQVSVILTADTVIEVGSNFLKKCAYWHEKNVLTVPFVKVITIQIICKSWIEFILFSIIDISFLFSNNHDKI